MIPGSARALLLLLAILGLLAPRVSGALALVAPDIRAVVICTGQGMMTLRLDAHGNPAQGIDQPDHCVLAHAVEPPARAELAPLRAPVVAEVARAGGPLIRAEGQRAARPPPRGPPAA